MVVTCAAAQVVLCCFSYELVTLQTRLLRKRQPAHLSGHGDCESGNLDACGFDAPRKFLRARRWYDACLMAGPSLLGSAQYIRLVPSSGHGRQIKVASMSGIAAAVLLPWSSSPHTVYDRLNHMLPRLTLRGQAGVAIAAFTHNKGVRYKTAFQPSHELHAIEQDEQDPERLPHVAIAQVRCRLCTDGESDDQSTRNRRATSRQLTISLDGALVNAREVRAELTAQGHTLEGRTHAELFLKLVEHVCERDYWRQGVRVNYENVFREIDERIDGAISALLLDAQGNLIAFRNRYGLRPLEFMQTDDGFLLFASENCAFAGLLGKSDQIGPGYIKYVDGKNGHCFDRCVSDSQRAAKLCVYEPLYLGSPDTSIEGRSHLVTRHSIGFSLGELIARRLPAEPDAAPIIVSSMPHTGGPYADGLFSSLVARGVNVERREVIETQISERTLIGPNSERKRRIAHKYRLASIDVEKRSILMADEALIRGDTSQTVTNMLLAAGAKAVHWAIGSPPIVAPNYYGVNIETIDELAFWRTWKGLSAQQRNQSLLFKDMEPDVLRIIEGRIAASISATTVTYLPFARLTSLLPRGSEGIDLSPFTFEMPTPAGQTRANRNLHNLVADHHRAA
ncbi:hypothetical protein [Bradyrhizobium sp. Ghvi]|uniref:hypothetical protein n=1 Tax=Bradyrhizobium sp. Ghvi TaxID=1855319 RepID=UPI001FCD517C|nr:hypothetical protein [Bradyrhizobium sp. Ghvi]